MKDTESGKYMDGWLNVALHKGIKMVKKDMDLVFVIDGMERSGKSVIAQQMASEVDPTFNIDRIVFTPSEFKNAVMHAKKYQAVVYDEAYGGMSSRQAMSYINIGLVKCLAEIGQKNLFIFVVLPSYFELDRYVALHRSRVLIHVYMKGMTRGFFSFYDIKKKKDMWLYGKKSYSYCVKPNFSGRFTNWYSVDETDYRAKKLSSLTKSTEYAKDNYVLQRNALMVLLSNKGMSQREISEELEKMTDIRITREGVNKAILQMKCELEKKGI